MFPQTEKTVTIGRYVRVEFNLEEMDMSGFKVGATYEEIIAWVRKEYGFHVTHLNIAQVKRKYGIIERQNYNLPKTDGSKQPQCTPEKERAIIDALRHYSCRSSSFILAFNSASLCGTLLFIPFSSA